jgi:hypothetical protein
MSELEECSRNVSRETRVKNPQPTSRRLRVAAPRSINAQSAVTRRASSFFGGANNDARVKGGDAAFGLRAQWRRTDFECADPPCGVDQPAKAWRALGRYRSKRWYGGTICELLLLRVRGLVNALRGLGVQTVQTLFTCQPAAMLVSGACWRAGLDRSEVVGVARRSGTGGARRKYLWLGVAICQLPGARYGAPRVGVPW